MFGLLNIDKPRGPTSRDVVNRVARLIKPHKAGHAGTLDPLATGVLVVAVGPATRLIEYVQQGAKTYLATFLLGRASDTDDIEGTLVEARSPYEPSADEILRVLPQFRGPIQQRPPAYSAIKVAGQRSYDLARRGESVELTPREVVVHDIQLERYAYPELDLLIQCGSGTYIRALGRDIAQALGTEGVMSALRRTQIGPFAVADALNYDRLDADTIARGLLPPQTAFPKWKPFHLSADGVRRLANGQPLQLSDDRPVGPAYGLDSAGRLVAVLEQRASQMWPVKCFVTQSA